MGYVHRGDLGVPDREAFAVPEDFPRHHLYLTPTDSLSLKNHLELRDYLRANPERAKAYGDLKHRLAEEFPNAIDSYVDGKTDFILGIFRDLGFSEEELAAIEGINRMNTAS